MKAVTDNPERSRYELHTEAGLVGWLSYRPAGESVILAHTEVLEGHEGEGLGGVLVRAAIEATSAEGKTVIPTCPFAADYIRRHPDLIEFVAPWARKPLR